MKLSAIRLPVTAPSPFWMALSLATLALIAVADTLTPLMRSLATLYVLPLLIAIFARQTWFVVAVAVLSILLCVTSYALAPLPDGWSAHALINRGSAAVSLLVAAGLGMALLRIMERNEARRRAAEQQYELLRMGSTAGRLGGWIIYLPAGPVQWTDEVGGSTNWIRRHRRRRWILSASSPRSSWGICAHVSSVAPVTGRPTTRSFRSSLRADDVSG